MSSPDTVRIISRVLAGLLIHPGERLADELQALGMSANSLAKELGVPTNRLTQIMAGKRGISGDTALRLAKWFGTGRISG
ncbi:MAG: HigA family addiction module antitoxin [Syntrophobacteraceae bacterium]|nr:HigA family addiction module antitoxin [Syntrophobacteraceae bacterium]